MKVVKIILSAIIIFFIICFAVGSIISFGNKRDGVNDTTVEEKSKQESNKLIDVNQFARITPDELTKIMGEADKIEDYPLDGYNFKNYIYGNYEFFVIDNQVVRMYIHSEKYNSGGDSISYVNEKGVFEMLGVTPSEKIKKIADTPQTLRYQLVSDKIADLWVSVMDKEKKTIDEIKVTYNLNYFS
jgi:hypothetical protein|nr:MAG TPA: hypothetical protein [Caudoviricetes sp.]